MKAVPKVNTDGLYMEDELVDDAFSGVVPFYAEPEPPVFDPEASEEVEEAEDAEEAEPEIKGYIVGVPVPAGLFRPKFNLKAWEAYLKDAWAQLPEEDREEALQYVGPDFPDLWIEGLSQEEIDKLTKPQPGKASELDLIKQRLVAAEERNEQLAGENTLNQVALMELHAMILNMYSDGEPDEI